MLTAIPRRQIGRTSVSVTALGCGTAPLGNLYSAVSDAEASSTVRAAYESGARYFDTAPYYGHGLAERRLGRALDDRSLDDAIVSTKVGRLLLPRAGPPARAGEFDVESRFEIRFDYSYAGVMQSIESSLERLGRSRVDLCLIHDIGVETHGPEQHANHMRDLEGGGMRALDELRADERVRAVGLGVNECEVALEVMGTLDIDCILLAGRYTLLDQSALAEVLPAAERHGVSVILGGPFNSGVLASGSQGDGRYDYAPADDAVRARVGQIESIGREYGVKLTAAALQFPLAHRQVVSVVPGARSRNEAQANAEAVRSEIPAAFWAELVASELLPEAAPTP